MRNRWSIISVICIAIGIFGLFKYGINTSNDVPYTKRWTFDVQELKRLHIETDYSSDVRFVKSVDGENYVEARGDADPKVIEKLQSATLQNGELGIDLNKQDSWDILLFNMKFHTERQEIVIALSDPSAIDALTIDTSSHDVKVTDVAANKVEMISSSGDLELENVQAGNVTVETSSGDIAGSGVTGTLNATSSSGDIRFDEIAGNTTARASSGDVKLTFIGAIAANIETSSGDVSVTAPQGFDGVCDVSTSSGSIKTPDSKHTTTDLIKIRTSSGDILIR